jgi:hypothetical protein
VKIRRVIISQPAEGDIGGAFRRLAEADEFAAIRWYNRRLEVIYSLKAFSERWPLAPESKHLQADIRQALHGRGRHKYRILFDITDDEVRVLHVRHGARLALGESPPAEEE